MRALGLLFLGYGLGILQFAEPNETKILFVIPMILGLIILGIEMFRNKKQINDPMFRSLTEKECFAVYGHTKKDMEALFNNGKSLNYPFVDDGVKGK